MRKKVRTLRHWKQRFKNNADFIWRRPVIWQGKAVKAGDPIPKSLAENKTKLRRFWEARVIELAEFEEPDVLTGQKPEAPIVDPIDENIPLGPSEDVTSVMVYDDEVSIDEIVDLALTDFGGTILEWNALEWLDREERMQNVVEMMLDLGEEDEPEPEIEEDESKGEVSAEVPSISGKEPGDLITKETDRKWHVEGVDEVLKSKTLATAKAVEMIAEAKAAESSEDDTWLDGDHQED